ncbi:hypothetical protein MRB53_016852 [Persea americana]|uniref:Uncharacterized protein n=1 Tax=Persea americana TaxID=3435 RepID=A0ACC2M413_PERAE|nr:hypothetical protein MRB53_016852 [Persea americana]
MAASSILKISLTISPLCFLCFFACICNGHYSEFYRKAYSQGDELYVLANSITSISTQLPFSYYSLPYCKPCSGIRKRAQNLGELLMGNQIVNSPYRFRMNINESLYLCTSNPLTEEDVELLKQRTNDLYQVHMILDKLPVARFAKYDGINIRWTGFPVGYSSVGSSQYYIINHLKFKVLIHEYHKSPLQIIGTGEEGMGVIKETGMASGYEIVGFEVIPCSVQRDPKAMSELKMYDRIAPVNCKLNMAQVVQEQVSVTYTFEVEFVESNMQWSSRWDAYLKMEGSRIHWFSICSSLLVILFLGGIVFNIFFNQMTRDFTMYEGVDIEPQAQTKEEIPGWKLVIGDVFREPNCGKLLCVMVGDGVQIAGTAAVVIVFAALGFMSPAYLGILLTGMIVLYLFLGIIAGYVGVRLWRTIKGTSEGWRSLSWSVAFPLTLLGGYLGTLAEAIKFPVRTNHVPREIPARKYTPWLLVLSAGTLPFGTLFLELFVILSSIWLGRFYYVFGFLLLVLLLFLIVCAEVSVILTYKHLCAEDWRWWWNAFFASGSVGLYVFLFSISYLIYDLKGLNGPVSATLYLGYSLLVAFVIMLATGTIGFLTSFYFVYNLFSSIKS